MATRQGPCGAGKISHDFSVAMNTLPPGDHQIAVIASRSIERAKDLTQKHGIPEAYGSYTKLANDPEIGKLAIWSRCFPVYAEVHRLLAEEAVGEVKLVKASFGSPQLDVPQSVQKELGGGALLDTGVYCFVLRVVNSERGVEESVVMLMKFSRKRMALCAFSVAARLPNDAVITGVKVLAPMHCPTKLVMNDEETEYPLPEPLCYEAEEVRQCLLKGLKKSPRMPVAASVLPTEIMDVIRKQVGVVFNQDSQ